MATRAVVPVYSPNGQNQAVLVQWSGLLQSSADVGAPFEGVDWADRTVHVTGTFGVGGAVTLQGSNNGVDWVTLNDPQGTDIVMVAAAPMFVILENPRYVRPAVTAGDGATDLVCAVWARRPK